MKYLPLVFLAPALLFSQQPPAYSVRTVAGGITIPFPAADVTTSNIRLLEPRHAVVDPAGNVYLSDSYYNRILKIAADGRVTPVAGADQSGFSGDDGLASEALLSTPEALALSSSGDLYVCDSGNHRIRKITADGVITTIAGNGGLGASGDNGPALEASIGNPWGIAVDSAGVIYFSDSSNHVIRRIDTNGVITTIAGTTAGFAGDGGPATQARLQNPRGIALDATGNLYFADNGNHRVRVISTAGAIRTFAGTGTPGFAGDNGPALSAGLFFPSDVRVGASGNVFIADQSNGQVRRVLVSGTIQTVPRGSLWNSPVALAFDNRNGLLVIDSLRRQISRVDLATLGAAVYISGVREGASGDGGPAAEAGLFDPWGIALDPQGNLYIADSRDSRVRRISTDGIITTVAGNGTPEQTGNGGTATGGGVGSPRAIAIAPSGAVLVSTTIGGGFIRSISPEGILSTIAGAGPFGAAGDGGPALSATFFGLTDMTVDEAGNIYVADSQTHRVRRIDTQGIVTTIAGSGTAGFAGDGGSAVLARLQGPGGVAIDPQGRIVIADTGNHRIRRIEANGNIVTIAGLGVAGAAGDGGPAIQAPLNLPRGVRYDAEGNLWIALPGRIRRISPDGNIYGIAGTATDSQSPESALGTTIANAVSIAPGPGGVVYFVESAARRVRVLEPIPAQ
ncbi:MAG: hypothetical protein JST93_32790 [Acidobacteria bacterium]|nr:hypothetical protein [Acidobacteriota bacterium]